MSVSEADRAFVENLAWLIAAKHVCRPKTLPPPVRELAADISDAIITCLETKANRAPPRKP